MIGIGLGLTRSGGGISIPTGPSPALVAGSTTQNGASVSTTSAATIAVTAGDLIIVASSYGVAPGTVSFTDTQTNTYTVDTHKPSGGSAPVFSSFAGYAVASATGSVTVTAHFPSSQFGSITLDKITNAGAFDVSNGSSTSYTAAQTATSGTALTTANGDAIWVYMIDQGSHGLTATAGLTQGQGVAATYYTFFGTQAFAASVAGTATVGSSTTQVNAIMLCFKPKFPINVVSFPTNTSTGVPSGTTLTDLAGATYSTPNQIITAMRFTAPVTITASGVQLVNCKFDCGALPAGFPLTINAGAVGVHITNATFDGNQVGGGSFTAINDNGTSTQVIGCNVQWFENAFEIGPGGTSGAHTVYSSNYVANFLNAGTPHYDGWEILGPCAWVDILGNTCVNIQGQTSAINWSNFSGALTNVNMDSNFLSGGSYVIYVDGHFATTVVSGFTVTNNKVGIGSFGYFNFNATGNVNYVTPVATGNYDTISGLYLN